jgi:hypothetical protein
MKKGNRRNHRFIVSKENPLVMIPNDLDEFVRRFYVLLDAAKSCKSYGQKNWMMDTEVWLYQYLVEHCLVGTLFKWPTMIHDRDALNSLYADVFKILLEIQVRMSELLFVKGDEKPERLFSLMHKFGSFKELSPGPIEMTYYNFQQMGYTKEIEPLLDAYWKIYCSLTPIVSDHVESDWRTSIRKYEKGSKKSWPTQTKLDEKLNKQRRRLAINEVKI